jgi:hypothetical protein
VNGKLLYVLATLIVMMSRASARKWKTGDGGLVRWSTNCDFNAGDIDAKQSRPDECGEICIANLQCTHFTANLNRTCILKNIPDGLEERSYYEANGGANCGFIINRSKQPIYKLSRF